MVELILAWAVLVIAGYTTFCWGIGPAMFTDVFDKYSDGVKRAHAFMFFMMLLVGATAIIVWAIRIVYQTPVN